MANDTTITIIGNMVGDPELRFTPNGAAVANFTIASTPRNFDRTTNEWKEAETLFLRARIWREAAENAAATLKKGMRVIAQGKLKAHSYETKEGERRTGFELEVEEVGPSLRFASAQVLPNPRGYVQSAPPVQQGGGAGPVSQTPAQTQGQAPAQGAPQADPWSQQAGGDYGWGGRAQPMTPHPSKRCPYLPKTPCFGR